MEETSSRDRAAVDIEDGPGDVAGRGRGQERDGLGDLSGLPNRRRQVMARWASAYLLSAGFMSVSIGPGWTALTVIPFGPRSRAEARVKPWIANLVAL